MSVLVSNYYCPVIFNSQQKVTQILSSVPPPQDEDMWECYLLLVITWEDNSTSKIIRHLLLGTLHMMDKEAVNSD